MLYNQSHIKRFVAAIFLVLFAFSVTPRNVLHDWFANHKDETSLSKNSGSPTLKTFDYLCKTDNLVAESPFIESIPQFDFSTLQPFTQYQILTAYFFYSSQHFFFEHRGPPAIA
ncbi:MAG TPA: hypothetical protein VK559_03425 [Ferruginibacter sp.]|nr:hypothetical protein [Ferruginibacter sp.]